MKTILNKYLFLIKLISVGLMISYLGYKIYSDASWKFFSNYKDYHIKYISLAVLLTIVNWGFEAKKWQLLLNNIKQLSFFNCYKSVLAGLSLGIMTPNRVGNFIGRLAWVEKDQQHQATINTLLGNLAQFTSTLIFGSIGLFLVLVYQFSFKYAWVILLTSIFVIIFSFIVYFNPLLVKRTMFIRFLSDKTINSLSSIAKTSIQFKLKIIGLSVLRYVVFLIQYFLLFKAFNVDVDIIIMFGLISTVYLLTTLIPSIFFGKLFIRESVAVFVFSFVDIDTPLILLVAFILWVINLAIPALLGGLIWLNKSKNK